MSVRFFSPSLNYVSSFASRRLPCVTLASRILDCSTSYTTHLLIDTPVYYFIAFYLIQSCASIYSSKYECKRPCLPDRFSRIVCLLDVPHDLCVLPISAVWLKQVQILAWCNCYTTRNFNLVFLILNWLDRTLTMHSIWICSTNADSLENSWMIWVLAYPKAEVTQTSRDNQTSWDSKNGCGVLVSGSRDSTTFWKTSHRLG